MRARVSTSELECIYAHALSDERGDAGDGGGDGDGGDGGALALEGFVAFVRACDALASARGAAPLSSAGQARAEASAAARPAARRSTLGKPDGAHFALAPGTSGASAMPGRRMRLAEAHAAFGAAAWKAMSLEQQAAVLLGEPGAPQPSGEPAAGAQ